MTERSGRIVAAHKLLRRSRRTATGEFLADGAQACREAVAAERERPGTVHELLITATGGTRNVEIVRAAFAAGITVTEVTDRAAQRLSDAVTPQGITARCALPDGAAPDSFPRLAPTRAALAAVVVEASDPGNAGTIIRLADAAGADYVVMAGDCVDPFGPRAVRASAGSVFHLPVLRATEPRAVLADLAAAGLQTVATTGSATTSLDDATRDGLLELPTAWLFGSEAHGLPAELVDGADLALRVPIYGKAESLNLATAAAICLYASAAAQHA